jgi:uncharacterized iron-regulated membrane protein
VYAVHAWLGLVTGAFLLLLSLTGTVLVFADELDRALNPALLRVTPRAERATYDAMLAAVRARHPDASIVAFRALPERPDEAYTVSMRVGGRFWFAHVDPYTARVLGDRDADASLVRRLLVLHYALLVRPWGEAVIFLVGVALVGSVLTGLYVYRRSLGRAFTVGVRWRRGWRVAAADLHHVVGVASLGFNLGMAVTGASMLAPVLPTLLAHEPAPAAVPAQPGLAISLDRLVARAADTLPGFRPGTMVVPQAPGEPVTFYGRVPGPALFGAYASRVRFDAATGRVTEAFDVARGTLGERLDAVAGPLHFGNYGGAGVKLLYAALGLTPGALAVSGFALWWRRTAVRRRPRRA